MALDSYAVALKEELDEAMDGWTKAQKQRDRLLDACKHTYEYLGELGFAYEGITHWDIMDRLKATIKMVEGNDGIDA